MAYLKCGVDLTTDIVLQPASAILQAKQSLKRQAYTLCHIRALLAFNHVLNPFLLTTVY